MSSDPTAVRLEFQNYGKIKKILSHSIRVIFFFHSSFLIFRGTLLHFRGTPSISRPPGPIYTYIIVVSFSNFGLSNMLLQVDSRQTSLEPWP